MSTSNRYFTFIILKSLDQVDQSVDKFFEELRYFIKNIYFNHTNEVCLEFASKKDRFKHFMKNSNKFLKYFFHEDNALKEEFQSFLPICQEAGINLTSKKFEQSDFREECNRINISELPNLGNLPCYMELETLRKDVQTINLDSLNSQIRTKNLLISRYNTLFENELSSISVENLIHGDFTEIIKIPSNLYLENSFSLFNSSICYIPYGCKMRLIDIRHTPLVEYYEYDEERIKEIFKDRNNQVEEITIV